MGINQSNHIEIIERVSSIRKELEENINTLISDYDKKAQSFSSDGRVTFHVCLSEQATAHLTDKKWLVRTCVDYTIPASTEKAKNPL